MLEPDKNNLESMPKRSWYKKLGCIIALLVVAFFIYAAPYQNYVAAQSHIRYQDCSEKTEWLKQVIDKAIEQEKHEKRGVLMLEESCKTLFGVAPIRNDCMKVLRNTINKSCQDGTLKVRMMKGHKYEITAVAKDIPKCKLCWTEKGWNKKIRYYGQCRCGKSIKCEKVAICVH